MPVKTYPAKMEHFESMMSFIEEGARGQGFEGKILNKIKLAGEEILINVIKYAYAGGEGDIEISCGAAQPGGLELRISDSGIAFDPLEKKDPDINASVDERQIGGLGIYMTKQIMDDVRYERRGEKNVLTLVKNLAGG